MADAARPHFTTPLDPGSLKMRATEFKHMEKVRDEYREIPSYMATPAEMPEGVKHKNRYTNVLPTERTRVPLSPVTDDPASWFINANYVGGHQHDKAYIACQGPLPDTINDFWRMVWEQNVAVLVMTTGLMEGGRMKCHRYWPEKESPELDAGTVAVSLVNEEDYDEWIKTTLTLTSGNSTRTVIHMWYTGWPDHGAPDTAAPVVGFLRAVRTEQGDNKAPVLVHCSAGIGRTGTFMAIDIGMHELQSEWRVTDIRGNVEKMRKERGGSVQAPVQYDFIHKALYEFSDPAFPHSMFGGNQPFDITLVKSKRYPYLGFTIRGSKPIFLSTVDEGGLAQSEGARMGDQVLEINGEDCSQWSHKECVKKIVEAGDSLRLKLLNQVPAGGVEV